MKPSNDPRVNWRTHLSLLLLALVYIFLYIDRQSISILIEPIKREFGASDTAMGLLTGLVFGVLYALLGMPVGKWADRGTRRTIVALACALWSLATLACGMAQQFWQLLLARMSVAVGEAGGMAPSISLVSDLYPKQHRSFAISLFMLGPHFGVLIGLALGGWIAQHYGWRATFLWFGAPGMVLAALVWWLVREPQRGAFDHAPAVPAPASLPLGVQVRALLADAAFRNICLACGIAGMAGYGYGVWVPSFLVRTHGLSLAQAGLVFGVASGVGAVAGSIFFGWLCDRLVQRDARWQLGLPLLGVLASIPSAYALFLWPTGAWLIGSLEVPHAIVFALAFGVFAGSWPALSYAATSQLVAPGERSVAAATLNLFLTLFGLGGGPLVTGVLSDLLTPRFGSEALRFALLAVVSLFALTVFFFARALGAYGRRLQAQGATPKEPAAGALVASR